jgi:tetratricopeptide (TPR) repeat protein/transcriptional regulator with XRE-family HTH domain
MVRGFRALMIWFLSLWHGVSQKQLASRSGIPDKRVSYLLGRLEIEDEEYEKLMAATYCKPADAQIVTGCIDGLKSVAANKVLTDEELEQVERGVREGARLLRDLLAGLALGSRWVPVFDGYPHPADVEPARFHAWRLWEVLETMSEADQLDAVRLNEDHHSWALMERVCEASVEQASRDVQRAASLARVAQEIADRVQGPEIWQNAVRGYAAAHGSNALRVAGELKAARAGLEEAKRLWNAGSDPDRVLDPGRLLDLEASLCRDERQFEKALALLDEAYAISRCPARILIKKAFTREVMGEYGQAIEVLLQAEPLLDRSTEPRLWYKHRANLAVNYSHIGDHDKAAGLIEEARSVAIELGDELDLLRLLWVGGRIAAGLGRREEAHQNLTQAARQFEARDMWYDVALSQLEIAALLIEEGRAGEVSALARDLVKIFDAKGVHREALAALRLFREATQRAEATAELARAVLAFLFRARYDQSLQFSVSEARQLAVRVEHGTLIGLEAVGVEPGSCVGLGEAVGVEYCACVDGRIAPERRDEDPEAVQEDRLAGRRGEERPGKNDSEESWAHWKVSCAAPASVHHGPRGPRLPDILRQVAEKNPGLRPVDNGMTWKNRLVRLVRALAGQTQERFSETTQVDLRMLDHYEQGKRQPGTETLERVARRGYGLEVHEAEEVLQFAETLSRPRQRPGQIVEVVLDDLAFLVSRVYQRLVRLPLETAIPGPEDPQHIERLWTLLKDLPEDRQRAVVTAGRKFQNWALAVRICDESEIQASRDLERAASLARLAQWIADLVPGPEGWRNRLRGLVAGYAPNVLRVRGDLKSARAGMETARQLWATGSDPAGLLDPGKLLDLDASLCRDERRFEDALARLDEAAAVGRNRGRILVKKGFTLEVMGDYEGAIEALIEAERHIDQTTDLRLWYKQRGNLAVNYCHIGRFQEASELVQQVRPVAEKLGDELDLLRITALEGRIAAGQGRGVKAVLLLNEVRQAFAGREMWYDVALIDLEMAPLLLAEGATAKVKEMAGELVVKFKQQGIHREALAALQLFHEAAEREKATAELARRVLEFLFRARWDERLRFGAG